MVPHVRLDDLLSRHSLINQTLHHKLHLLNLLTRILSRVLHLHHQFVHLLGDFLHILQLAPSSVAGGFGFIAYFVEQNISL